MNQKNLSLYTNQPKTNKNIPISTFYNKNSFSSAPLEEKNENKIVSHCNIDSFATKINEAKKKLCKMITRIYRNKRKFKPSSSQTLHCHAIESTIHS